MKIDAKNWLEFRVGDLFNIKPTKSYTYTNAKLLGLVVSDRDRLKE